MQSDSNINTNNYTYTYMIYLCNNYLIKLIDC